MGHWCSPKGSRSAPDSAVIDKIQPQTAKNSRTALAPATVPLLTYWSLIPGSIWEWWGKRGLANWRHSNLPPPLPHGQMGVAKAF